MKTKKPRGIKQTNASKGKPLAIGRTVKLYPSEHEGLDTLCGATGLSAGRTVAMLIINEMQKMNL